MVSLGILSLGEWCWKPTAFCLEIDPIVANYARVSQTMGIGVRINIWELKNSQVFPSIWETLFTVCARAHTQNKQTKKIQGLFFGPEVSGLLDRVEIGFTV